MKKLLIILILIGSNALIGKSQNSITIDSAFGEQLSARLYATNVTGANESVKVQSVWSYDSTFVPAFVNTIGTFVNLDSIPDTVAVADTIDFTGPGPGTYHFKLWSISLITGDTVSTIEFTKTVTAIIVIPSISFAQPGIPSVNGGLQSYNYNTGNTVADLEVWVSPGDTNFSFPFMVYTIQLLGSGQNTFTFTGYPSQDSLSYKFVLINSVGSDTTSKNWIITLANGSDPWIGNLDSSVVTMNSILAYFKLVTNGTNCSTTTYLALLSNPNTPIDSVVQNFAGQNGINQLGASFVGLSPNTVYVVWTCVYAGTFSMCSQQAIVTTTVTPTLLSFTITTTQTIPNTVMQRFEVSDTSETNGSWWLEIANLSDPGFSSPIYASSTNSFLMGVNNHTLDVSVLSNGFGFIPNTTYLAKVKGFNSGGEFDESPVIQFTFLPLFTGISEIPEFSNVFVSYNELVVRDDYRGELQMLDVSGRKVGTFQKIDFGEARFPLSDFSPGIYFLRGDGVKAQKFMIN